MNDIHRMLHSLDSETQSPKIFANMSLAIDSDCSNSWLNYLQMLNGLCTSGGQVAANIRAFTSKMGIEINFNNLPEQAEWDSVNQALLAATITAHSQSISAINSFEYCHHDQLEKKNIIENMLSIISMQYKFCMISCERLMMLGDNSYVNPISNELKEPDGGDPSYGLLNSLPFYNFLPNESAVISKTNSNLFSNSNYARRPSINSNRDIEKSSDSRWYSDNANLDLLKFNQGPSVFSDLHRNIENSRLFPILDSRKSDLKLQNIDVVHGSALKFFDPVRSSDCADGSQRNNFGPEKSSKGSMLKNVRFDFQLPSTSCLSAAAQTAQLRRWSEAAAHEMNDRQDDSGNIRRWSVPWDGGKPLISEGKSHWSDENQSGNLLEQSKREEQDPLEMAIVLLSYKPQHQVGLEKLNTMPETIPRRSCSSSGASRSYSIWSGSGIIPFLQLPESQE